MILKRSQFQRKRTSPKLFCLLFSKAYSINISINS